MMLGEVILSESSETGLGTEGILVSKELLLSVSIILGSAVKGTSITSMSVATPEVFSVLALPISLKWSTCLP